MIDVEERLRALPKSGALRMRDDLALASLQELELFHLEPGRRGVRPAWGVRFATLAAVLAAVLMAVVVLNAGGAYFAPRYSQTLADTPGIGPISGRFLKAVGLGPSDVTLVGDSSTSAGHTLKLEGAYADGLRIVLFVSIDGRGVSGNPKQYGLHPGDWGLDLDGLTLTDQFLHSYNPSGVGGPTDMPFEPLAWPAIDVGARLTLHVSALWAVWDATKATPGKVFYPQKVHGNWNLHVTVSSQPLHTIPLPAPVHSGAAVYTFTSIVASGKTLVIRYSVAGARDIWPSVYDAGGNYMQMEEGGGGETTVLINGPGRYRLQFGDLSAPDQQRWIDVP